MFSLVLSITLYTLPFFFLCPFLFLSTISLSLLPLILILPFYVPHSLYTLAHSTLSRVSLSSLAFTLTFSSLTYTDTISLLLTLTICCLAIFPPFFTFSTHSSRSICTFSHNFPPTLFHHIFTTPSCQFLSLSQFTHSFSLFTHALPPTLFPFLTCNSLTHFIHSCYVFPSHSFTLFRFHSLSTHSLVLSLRSPTLYYPMLSYSLLSHAFPSTLCLQPISPTLSHSYSFLPLQSHSTGTTK